MTIIIFKLLMSMIVFLFALDFIPQSKRKFWYRRIETLLYWLFILSMFSFGFSLIWFGWV